MNRCTLILLFLFAAVLPAAGRALKDSVQDNPVVAPEAVTPPVIDGVGSDACWANAAWQRIAQVWIPYAAVMDSTDFSGRYKVVWSSSTNLLYFLIEVHDDVFVDGFIPGGSTADIYNYDIVEVFIDENHSGGLHIFDGIGADTLNVGSNAENAFAYHIYAAFPPAGGVTTAHYVYDMDGTSWSNNLKMNYTAHIPSLALTRNGNTAVWEFSLIVYNDTYEDTMGNKQSARAQLAAGKEMGLSVAYCDNDHPAVNPKVRDNMIGSVYEPSPGNLHWQDASYFGRVRLMPDVGTGVAVRKPLVVNAAGFFPNPATDHSRLEAENSYRGEVTVRMYNLIGQEILHASAYKTERQFRYDLPLRNLPCGMYFTRVEMGRTSYAGKLVVVPHK